MKKSKNKNTKSKIRWTRLCLKLIPLLKDEIESISNMYIKNPSEEMYQELSFRSDQLEQFYLENDSDPRALLVEKLRLDLQQMLLKHPPIERPIPTIQMRRKAEGEEDQKGQEQVQIFRQKNDCTNHLEEYAASPAQHVSKSLEPGHKLISELQKTKMKNSEKKNKTTKKSAAHVHIYPWERKQASIKLKNQLKEQELRKQKDQEKINATDSSLNSIPGDEETKNQEMQDVSNMDPAQAADTIASLSYAAAHSGQAALLTPFGSNFQATKESILDSLQNECSSDVAECGDSDMAESNRSEMNTCKPENDQVLASFQINLSEDEYYEVIRRKEIIKAREKREIVKSTSARRRNSQAKQKFLSTCPEPYSDRKVQHEYPFRETNQSAWVSKQNFYVSNGGWKAL